MILDGENCFNIEFMKVLLRTQIEGSPTVENNTDSGRALNSHMILPDSRDERFKLWVATLTSECMAHPAQASPTGTALPTPR